MTRSALQTTPYCSFFEVTERATNKPRLANFAAMCPHSAATPEESDKMRISLPGSAGGPRSPVASDVLDGRSFRATWAGGGIAVACARKSGNGIR